MEYRGLGAVGLQRVSSTDEAHSPTLSPNAARPASLVALEALLPRFPRVGARVDP
jgi:hypothetical protein